MAKAKTPETEPRADAEQPPAADESAAPEASAPAETNNAALTDDSVAALVGRPTEDILAWRDHGDRVVVVTRDGQKLTNQVAKDA